MLFRKNSKVRRTTYKPIKNPRVHVFIYTYNKVKLLHETLQSLQATEYQNYKIFILNNGSPDKTEAFLYSLPKDKFPEIKIINLPINIGAPAARNWLINDPENRYADFVAYLDDDISLPSAWIENMIKTFEDYPQAGVVGAKVLFPKEPKTIQHTGGIITAKKEWVHSINAHSFEPDQGQHDYIAPRHYVMGCAHMYRKEVFDVVGDYDIRFSPTQFDEVEHQIRMRLYGYQAIYNGFIEVVHKLQTGMNLSRPALISREANRLKMTPLFTDEEISALVDENLAQYEKGEQAKTANHG